MRAVVILFELVTLTYAESSDIRYPVMFGKSPENILHEFSLDFELAKTYIVQKSCVKVGHEGYDPREHRDYQPAPGAFKVLFDSTNTSTGDSVAFGHNAYDFISVQDVEPKRIKFGLVTRIQGGDPFTTTEYIDVTGRAAMALDQPPEADFTRMFFGNGSRILYTCYGVTTRGIFPYPSSVVMNVSAVDVLPKQSLWVVRGDGWKFGGSVSVTPMQLQVSSSVSYITLDDNVFRLVAKTVKAIEQPDGRYRLDCIHYNGTSNFTIVIAGQPVDVESKDYIEFYYGECYLKIRPGAKKNRWQLGGAFTDSVGVALNYDQRTMNFFKLSDNDDDVFRTSEVSKNTIAELRSQKSLPIKKMAGLTIRTE